MSRKVLFPLVLLLAAAALAGLLALSRTAGIGEPASASTGSDPAIAFRLRKLDAFEQSLRAQLAKAKAASAGSETVYRVSPSAQPSASSADDEHGFDDEHESGRDD